MPHSQKEKLKLSRFSIYIEIFTHFWGSQTDGRTDSWPNDGIQYSPILTSWGWRRKYSPCYVWDVFFIYQMESEQYISNISVPVLVSCCIASISEMPTEMSQFLREQLVNREVESRMERKLKMGREWITSMPSRMQLVWQNVKKGVTRRL